MLRFSIILLFLFSTNTATSQELWGNSSSNYAGSLGLFLNPSAIAGAPYLYEIHLLGADVFAENTYIYFPSNVNILQKSLTGNIPDGRQYKVDDSRPLQYGFGHTRVFGPSYIRNRKEFAWSIHTGYRQEVSAVKVPEELARTLVEDFNYAPLYGVEVSPGPFAAAWLNWAELGGTYARVYRETEKTYIKWGATGNLLAGFTGAAADFKNFDFSVVDSSTLRMSNVDATLYHAMDAGNNGNFFALRGAGASVTLGATYIRERNRGVFDCNKTSDQFRKYKYRMGVSIMDIGMIHFFNQTQTVPLYATSVRDWNGIDSVDVASVAAFDTLISNVINGTASTITEDAFGIWLPAALSLQFDYYLAPRIYANATWINRVRLGPKQVARGNQLNLSVRYERKRFEGSLNFTIFEYKQPSVGMGFRYAWLILGSDRLLQWLGVSDVKSADLYFGLRIQFCQRPFSLKRPDCDAF